MGRSLRFRVYRRRPIVALFRLGFPLAPARKALTKPSTVTRRVIMQKARRHTLPEGHSAPTACRHVVSGSFNSPSRGSFHLSLTLLDTLSVVREYLALGDGPPGFSPGSTCPDLLGVLVGDCTAFEYETVTLCGSAFQRILLAGNFVTPCDKPHNPVKPKQDGLGYIPFRSPLLRKSFLLSFPTVT